MTGAQRQRVDELFGDLFELDGAAQAAGLADIDDPEVRAEVASLLDHIIAGEEGLSTSIGNLMQAATESGAFEDRTIGPGTRFERYRIERKLGQGGMGDVYEATRDNDFHKQVALKIVRYGLDSDFARGRFQQERQTLAGLEHPYIARLIDGGEAANGCPYLVLEFVDGVAIDAYARGCTRDDILSLFLKVCEAVEYAHRNLIIHRDLKPANILVTADGTPKLLDFGIAKLLILDPAANVDVTQTMAVALTPQYASPEQIRGLPITTASDVYSLGVVLYQLLTRRKPYDVQTTTALEMERVICLEPPTPPHIGNELDDILLMALRKEPERRYPSVSAFADDLTRFTTGRPVLAAPDTFRYRTRKYIGRHWVGLAAATAATLALSIGAGVAMYQAHIAKQRLAQVRGLTKAVLFDIHDQLTAIPGTLRTRGLIVTTAQAYLKDMARTATDDPELEADLAQSYVRLGDAQGDPRKSNLGDPGAAEISYLKAIRVFDRVVTKTGTHRIEATDAYRKLLLLYVDQHQIQKARALLPATHSLAASLRPEQSLPASLVLAKLYLILAEVDSDTVDFNPDVSDTRRAIAYVQPWSTLPGSQPGDEVFARLDEARLYTAISLLHQADLAEAQEQTRAAVVDKEAALKLHPQDVDTRRETAVAEGDLGMINDSVEFPSLGNFAAAAEWEQKALLTLRPALDADAEDLSTLDLQLLATANLAYDLLQQRSPQSTAVAQRALHQWKDMEQGAKLGPGDLEILLNALRGVVMTLRQGSAHAESVHLAMQLLAERRRLLAARVPNDDGMWHLTRDLSTLADSERATGNLAAAASHLDEALQIARPLMPSAGDNVAAALAAADLYDSLRAQRAAEGNCEEAGEWAGRAVEVWRKLAPLKPYAAQRFKKAVSASHRCSRSK